MIVSRMAHKLPNPLITAKCGICFRDFTWNADEHRFECGNCKIAVVSTPKDDKLTFSTVFCDPNAKPCHQPPQESFRKVRHLRQDSQHKHFFVVYSYIYFPCILPKTHKGLHHHPFECMYSEEYLDYQTPSERDK